MSRRTSYIGTNSADRFRREVTPVVIGDCSESVFAWPAPAPFVKSACPMLLSAGARFDHCHAQLGRALKK